MQALASKTKNLFQSYSGALSGAHPPHLVPLTVSADRGETGSKDAAFRYNLAFYQRCTRKPGNSMADVRKVVLVELPAQELFNLVDQVETYPEFLPWCGGTEVLERTDTSTVATLHILYHGVRAHFTTRNEKQWPSAMQMHLKEGPFKKLEGQWQFTPLGDVGCKVEFSLHYEFSNRLLEKVLGAVFNHVATTFVDAFIKRAEQLKL